MYLYGFGLLLIFCAGFVSEAFAGREFVTSPIQTYSLASPPTACGSGSSGSIKVIVKNLAAVAQTITVSIENERISQQIAVLNASGFSGWRMVNGNAASGTWVQEIAVSRTQPTVNHRLGPSESAYFSFEVVTAWLVSGLTSPLSAAKVNESPKAAIFSSIPASNLNVADATAANYSTGQALEYSSVLRFKVAEDVGAVTASAQAIALQLGCGADVQTTAAALTPFNGGRPF